jgi:uncharacterized membrane protein YphA (DoxX/SURF4 family)
MAGDSILARLTPVPLAAGEDPLQSRLNSRFPPDLARDWDAWFAEFVRHYGLDSQQRGAAEAKFQQQKEQVVVWLLQGTKAVSTTSPYGPPITTEKTVPQRIQEHKEKLEQARALQNKDYALTDLLFRSQVAPQVQALKADAARIRSELKSELEQQTTKMKDTLHETLTPEQRAKGPMPAKVEPSWLTQSRLEWIDATVRWGLFVVAVCLLLGICTRPACLAGAVLMVLFTVAMPALPWVPRPPNSEGHYFFVNKNVIEILALLVLTTLPTGRWLGLDGLLQFLLPWRWRRQPARLR